MYTRVLETCDSMIWGNVPLPELLGEGLNYISDLNISTAAEPGTLFGYIELIKRSTFNRYATLRQNTRTTPCKVCSARDCGATDC